MATASETDFNLHLNPEDLSVLHRYRKAYQAKLAVPHDAPARDQESADKAYQSAALDLAMRVEVIAEQQGG